MISILPLIKNCWIPHPISKWLPQLDYNRKFPNGRLLRAEHHERQTDRSIDRPYDICLSTLQTHCESVCTYIHMYIYIYIHVSTPNPIECSVKTIDDIKGHGTECNSML